MIPTASQPAGSARRPIKARGSRWAAALARWLTRWGVPPNAISLFSVVCAMEAAASLLALRWVQAPAGRAGLYLLAIVGIQARLICNLLDGMVAVEGGRRGKAGEIFNDLPDRIADPLIFAAAGYAAAVSWSIELGWAAAVLALLTAYVRVLGHSAGAGVYFIGPMAKQHRMATLTAACILGAISCRWQWDGIILSAALAAICVGCIVTMVRRLRNIISDLERR